MAIRKVMLCAIILSMAICLSACGSSANNGPKVIEETQMETTIAEETEVETTVEETTEVETTEAETTKEEKPEETEVETATQQQENEAEVKEVIELQSFESMELLSDTSVIELHEESTEAKDNPLKICKQKDTRAKLNFSYVSDTKIMHDIKQGIIFELNENAGGLGIVNNIGDISTFSLDIVPCDLEETYHILYELRFKDDSRRYMAIEVTLMAD